MKFYITLDSIIRISLLPFGIYLNLNKYLERSYVLFISILSLTVSFCQFKNYSSLDSNIFIMDNTVYIGAMIFVINNFWISRCQKSLFLKILYRIEEDMKDEQFADLSHNILKKYFLNVGLIFAALFTFMISLPIWAAVFTNSELGSTATLLFPCWFPWTVDSAEMYAFTLLLQFSCAGILYSFAICCVVFVTCFMVVMEAHCELFEIKARRLGIRHRMWNVECSEMLEFEIVRKFDEWKRNKNKLDAVLLHDLEQILLYHQYVQSLVKDIVKCCKSYAANSFVIFIDATVLLSAMLLDNGGGTIYRVKILSTELFACLQFGLYCYMGESVNHLNTFFRDTLYDTEWYKQSVKLKKMMVIFMESTHYTLKLTAFNMWVMELSFFARMSRTCFSMFQLVYKMQHN